MIKLMPIVYVTEMPRSVTFYEALGLKPRTKDRSGMWFEFSIGDAVIALHKSDSLHEQSLTRVDLAFVSHEKLEGVIKQLQKNGLQPEAIVDEAFGRSFRIYDPDGLLIQINEHDDELYT